MAVTLRSIYDPEQVSLTPIGRNAEQESVAAQIAAEQEMAGVSDFGRANIRGQYQVPAMLSNALGQVVEPFSQTAAQPMFDFALQNQAEANKYRKPGDIVDINQINGLEDAASFASNMVGENLAQLPFTLGGGAIGMRVLGGVGGAGLLPTAGRAAVGNMVAGVPLSAGENVQEMRADPTIMASTTPAERATSAFTTAVPQAALDSVGDALLMGRAVGAGKALKGVFKDGVTPAIKDAAGHIAKAIPESALSEGLPETGQELLKQKMLNNLNPNRDTSKDTHALANSFFAGWAAGAPLSAGGRSMDVGWSQARDTRDAIVNLLSKRNVPQDTDDSSLIDWDNKDNETRNNWGKHISEKLFGDDSAPAHLKAAAQKFADRVAAGGTAARDAWRELKGGFDTDDTINSATDGINRFAEHVGAKEDLSSRPEEKMMYDAFRNHIDVRMKEWGSTGAQTLAYNAVKAAIKSDDLSSIPFDNLSEAFGGTEKLMKAVSELRANMVRDGQIDHDEGFDSLLKAAVSDGQSQFDAQVKAVRTYARVGVGDIDEGTGRRLVRSIQDGIRKYPSQSKQWQKEFDGKMRGVFGKNTEKIMSVFSPKRMEEFGLQDAQAAGDNDTTAAAVQEVGARNTKYVGQKVQVAMRNADSTSQKNSISGHGGFWNLGHSNKETRDSIKTSYKNKKSALAAQGNTVRELKPLEYAKEAGIDVFAVARALGFYRKNNGPESEAEVRKFLEAHPARMLAVEGNDAIAEERGDTITDQQIADLSKVSKQYERGDYIVSKEEAVAISKAINNPAKLRELGHPDAVKVVATPQGPKVINNSDSADNGRFTVLMNDGSTHTISAQELIRHTREQRGREMSPLQAFTDGIATVRLNPNVKKIIVKDRYGNVITPEKAKKTLKKLKKDDKPFTGEHREVAAGKFAKDFGPFGRYFRLEPNLLLGDAVRKSNKRASREIGEQEVEDARAMVEVLTARKEQLERQRDALSPDDEQALDKISDEIDEIEMELEGATDQLQELLDQYASQMARQAELEEPGFTGEDTSAYSKYDADTDTTIEHEGSTSHMLKDQVRKSDVNFNADGTPKQPHGKLTDRMNKPAPVDLKKVPGTLIHLRPGVRAEHVTEDMRETLKLAARIRGFIGDNAIATTRVAEQYVANAAAAIADGNRQAAKALMVIANERLFTAVQNEHELVMDDAEQSEKADKLKKAAAVLLKYREAYDKDRMSVLSNAIGYASHLGESKGIKGGKRQKFVAAPDRDTHRSEFLSAYQSMTDEELMADGIARNNRIERLEGVENRTNKQQQLLNMMIVENDIAREELRSRKAGKKTAAKKADTSTPRKSGYPFTDKKDDLEWQKAALDKAQAADKAAAAEQAEREADAEEEQTRLASTVARARRNAEEARAKAAEQHEAQAVELDKLGSELTAGSDEAAKMVLALGKAYRALSEAIRSGNFDKTELVAALREAWQHLKSAAKHADEARKEIEARVRKMVQQRISEFHQAAKMKADLVRKASAEAKAPAVDPGVEINDKLLGMIKRSADNQMSTFETGFEIMEDDAKLGPYDGYTTLMSEQDGEYTMLVVPNELYNELQSEFMAQKPETMSDELAQAVFMQVIENQPQMLGTHSVVSIGMTKDNEVYVSSALPNSAAEKSMAAKGVLEKVDMRHKDGTIEKGANKFKDLGIRSFVKLAGEATARLKKATGKQELNINWTRSGGANIGKDGGGKLNEEGKDRSSDGDVSAEEMAKIREYINKVLGPEIKLSLKKNLGSSGKWERVNGETFISIAARAANPSSTASHEAMHEFFQRLRDAGHEYATVLERAASSPFVLKQVKEKFKDDPNYTKIEKALDSDPHERVAYMFQLWLDSEIKIGPSTSNVFTKIKDFVRDLLGIIDGSKYAEQIMQGFQAGNFSTGKPLPASAKTSKRAKVTNAVIRTTEHFVDLLETAQNTLIDSNSNAIQKIGRLFSNETGATDKEIGFITARIQKTNQMINRVSKIVAGHKEEHLKEALDLLQQENGAISNVPEVAKIQRGVRKMLDDSFEYLKSANVDVNKQDNYFPRVWDTQRISNDVARFKSLLENDYKAAYGKDADPSMINGIVNTLILNRGATPVTENQYRTGYTPYMPASNKRSLDFVKSPEFAEFMQKDIVSTLSSYAYHAAHTAEYTKRFGKNGSGIRKMLKEAVDDAVGGNWKQAEQQAEAIFQKTKKALYAKHKNDPHAAYIELAKLGYLNDEVEIEHILKYLNSSTALKFKAFERTLRRSQKAIMAMEGTLGHDISELLRKTNSGLIVYENMRLLTMSLFSQVIDPFGVVVRGGTAQEAFDTFTRGIKGVWAGWRGKPIEDKMTKLAAQLGLIDMSGFMNGQGNLYSGVDMGNVAKWFNERLFRWNGVEGFSQGTRVGAMVAAISFIKSHANEATRNKHSDRYLAELGLTKADVKLTNGELNFSDRKIQDAIFRWVDGAIMRPNAAIRPSWASDPHYALFFHMKQFTYSMHKVLLERVVNEMRHGNYDPAFAMALSVPAIVASDFLRGLAQNGGEEPAWKRKWKFDDYIMDGVQRAGLLGIAQFGVDAGKWGVDDLLGPVASQINETVKDFDKAHKKHMRRVAAGREGAEDSKWIEDGAKKGLRRALPTGPMVKNYLVDNVM